MTVYAVQLYCTQRDTRAHLKAGIQNSSFQAIGHREKYIWPLLGYGKVNNDVKDK